MRKYIIDNLWLIVFLLWGLPLGYYRGKFRKIVYQTDKWIINIKPVFVKELKGLLGNLYPENRSYIRFRNFYRVYLVIYVLLFCGYSVSHNNSGVGTMKKVELGSHIPEFSLPDQNGNLFALSSILGKKNIVIYFYPKDDSPGCTKEACSFRDQYEIFKEVDAEIIGISSDDVASHKRFAEKYHLPYVLLSDGDNSVRNLFGVPTNLFGLLAGRVTYVVNRQGVVIHIFNSQLGAEKHIEESMTALKKAGRV
ncbi:MAG: peroxiredoxin [Ignavibacteriales bacterium]|nr:peroxiredoxin [Ignavibacteriales bacterium]